MLRSGALLKAIGAIVTVNASTPLSTPCRRFTERLATSWQLNDDRESFSVRGLCPEPDAEYDPPFHVIVAHLTYFENPGPLAALL